jgi:uroporphyrinogen-III decarboxylase
MPMTSKERLLTAINRGVPDRLPVTTHHLMTSFLDSYMDGIFNDEFFDYFNMDAIHWIVPFRSEPDKITVNEDGHAVNDEWRVEKEELPHSQYKTVRYTIITPGGELTAVLQSNEHTGWLKEHPIKEKSDIDLLGNFMPAPICDIDAVNQAAEAIGERGLVRGHIPGFDIFGQPGCWQDAACLVGIQSLIMDTFDDPEWVHTLLKILLERKKSYIQTLTGARYDILELGGGDASTTVISPKIFRNFVAPYDNQLITLAHDAGQKIAYHTCGGMMPILEDIADMGPDAMETFTPPAMGADVDLAEAKRRIGGRVCMIGGFDQFHNFVGCTPEQTRTAVRKCFDEAGGGGGFILSPSDHFFEADIELLAAFVDEAHRCIY